MTTSMEDEVKQLDVNKVVSYLESFIKSKCRLSEKSPNVYIPLSRTTFDDELWLKKVEVGRKDKSKREKVIMMVGATGSGKTTTINAMFNYIMGVEFEDHFRLKLSEEEDTEDQRKCITAYTIHHQSGFKIDYTLTIIDTPGFEYRGGITEHKEVMVQIKTFISSEGFGDIDMLDAVGFVIPSYPPRLTEAWQYIFNFVPLLLGKDIEDNIFMFCTFAISNRPPRVFDAVKAAKIPHRGYFKFNHEGLYSLDLDEDEIKFLHVFWNMGWTNFQNFFNQLNQVKSMRLKMTQEALLERTVHEDTLTNIQENTMLGTNKLEKTKEKEVLKELDDQHLRNLSDRITDQRSLRNLGGALKLPPHKISSSIENNRARYTEAAYELLRIWFIDKENPFVAWEELSKALEKAEMKMFKWEVLK